MSSRADLRGFGPCGRAREDRHRRRLPPRPRVRRALLLECAPLLCDRVSRCASAPSSTFPLLSLPLSLSLTLSPSLTLLLALTLPG
eukprot:1553438-Rhodomonas_salina.1